VCAQPAERLQLPEPSLAQTHHFLGSIYIALHSAPKETDQRVVDSDLSCVRAVHLVRVPFERSAPSFVLCGEVLRECAWPLMKSRDESNPSCRVITAAHTALGATRISNALYLQAAAQSRLEKTPHILMKPSRRVCDVSRAAQFGQIKVCDRGGCALNFHFLEKLANCECGSAL